MAAVNSASYQAPVSPASLVTLFGTSLASNTVQARPGPDGRLPTELDGVTVQAAGQFAELLYVSPSQINLVMPASIASGTVQIVVQPSGASANIEVRNAAPALFSVDLTGAGPAAVLNAVTFARSPFLVETAQNLGDDRRTRLALYGTGIRYAGNPFLDPAIVNAARAVQVQARDSAGNFYNLPVEFAGAAPGWFGLDQVNVVLPPQLDGLGTLSVSLSAGTSSSNVVTIAVDSLPADAIRLVGVSLGQSSIVAGASATATVTLNAPARSGGFAVNLSASSTFVQIPASVVVPAGQVSADFEVTTTSSGSGQATILAQANGDSRSAVLIVNSTTGPSLTAVALSAASVSGGTSIIATVTLSAPAPGGGAAVQLSSDKAAAQPPATVTIPFGQTSAAVTVPTTAVTATQTATLTATLGASSRSATLKVNPALGFTVSAASVAGGASITATIALGNPAPAQGAVVKLSSSDSFAAQAPPFVTIASGQTSTTVTIATSAVPAARTVTLTASYGASNQQVSFTVVPAGTPSVGSVKLSSGAVKGGSAVNATVTLSAAAGAVSAVIVTLESSNRLVAQTPASVNVAPGQTTASFIVTTSPVASTQTVTVTASSGGVSKSASLIVQ